MSIHLTINGQALSANPGETILDVCRRSGINVPTLCHQDGLPDVGACRLCIVEIDGVQRPAPSCTTPADEGMVIRTDTPRLAALRKQTIELLFGERNHICPFCPLSGNCELQAAAYAHGMDHVRYNYLFPRLTVDNSHRYITIDHNRCILCTRCIRACDQWVGAHVLDLDQRGARATIIADDGRAFGDSSCVSCGTCVSVCPTGALFEKRCAHWQGRLPLVMQHTICPGCAVGCTIQASIRHRQIGELSSAGGPNGNRILCKRGRFGLVNPTSARLTDLRIKRGTRWATSAMSDVLSECRRRLDAPAIQADPSRVIALLSPRLPLETIAAAHGFLTNVVGSNRWSILDRDDSNAVREVLMPEGRPMPLAGLDDLDHADLFLLLGCNLDQSHGVIASYVRRGVQHRGAKLLKINPQTTGLSAWTDALIRCERDRDELIIAALLKILAEEGLLRTSLPDGLAKQLAKLDDGDLRIATGVEPSVLREFARMYAAAQRPVVLCGRGVTRDGSAKLRAALDLVRAMRQQNEHGRWRLLQMAPGANSVGARLLGAGDLHLDRLDPHTADIAFVLVADDEPTWPREWMETLRTLTFVVALAAREHPVLDAAHVVIPTATWAERGGAFVNLEGRVQRGTPFMPPAAGVVDEGAFFEQLAKAWRGLDCGWRPPGVPASVQHVGDGRRIACSEPTSTPEFVCVERLVEELA